MKWGRGGEGEERGGKSGEGSGQTHPATRCSSEEGTRLASATEVARRSGRICMSHGLSTPLSCFSISNRSVPTASPSEVGCLAFGSTRHTHTFILLLYRLTIHTLALQSYINIF